MIKKRVDSDSKAREKEEMMGIVTLAGCWLIKELQAFKLKREHLFCCGCFYK